MKNVDGGVNVGLLPTVVKPICRIGPWHYYGNREVQRLAHITLGLVPSGVLCWNFTNGSQRKMVCVF